MSVGRCARKCRQLENLLGGGDGGGRARRAVPHISGGQNLVATNAVCSAVACECAPRSPPSRFIQCPRRRSALYSRSGASHKSLGALKFVVGRPRAPHRRSRRETHRATELRHFASTRLHFDDIIVVIAHFCSAGKRSSYLQACIVLPFRQTTDFHALAVYT